MNTPNPLVPQGTIPTRGRSHVRLAVFTILGIHVVLLGALLLQGCGRTAETEVVGEATNDTMMPPWAEPTNTTHFAAASPALSAHLADPGTEPSATPPAPGAPAHTPPPVPGSTPPPPTTIPQSVFVPSGPSAAPAAGGTTHVVVKNDSFATLAKKYNTTSKAIAEANPGVEPTRLKLGQKLNIPAPSPATAAHNSGSSAKPGSTRAGGDFYIVKSGDTLSKIAKAHGTTAAKLRSLNNLSTDKIEVGRKLALPPRNAPSPAEPRAAPTIDTTSPPPRFP